MKYGVGDKIGIDVNLCFEETKGVTGEIIQVDECTNSPEYLIVIHPEAVKKYNLPSPVWREEKEIFRLDT